MGDIEKEGGAPEINAVEELVRVLDIQFEGEVSEEDKLLAVLERVTMDKHETQHVKQALSSVNTLTVVFSDVDILMVSIAKDLESEASKRILSKFFAEMMSNLLS